LGTFFSGTFFGWVLPSSDFSLKFIHAKNARNQNKNTKIESPKSYRVQGLVYQLKTDFERMENCPEMALYICDYVTLFINIMTLTLFEIFWLTNLGRRETKMAAIFNRYNNVQPFRGHNKIWGVIISKEWWLLFL
jgi:hypothetical protein